MMRSLAFLSACCSLGLSSAQLPPGAIDHTFDPGDGFEVWINFFESMRVVPMPDDKLLVGGHFISFDGHQQGSFLQLHADGTHDATFNANNNVVGGVRDIAVDGNTGKIVLAGITQLDGGTPSGGMAVLLPDGSVDPDFDAGSGFTGNNLTVTAVAVQGDKYIVGGRFYQYQGATRRFLTRINTDGSVDNTFTQPFNNYLDGGIRKILVLPNDDFVVIGSLGFDSFEVDARLWYFNADGSINTTLTGAMGQINGGLGDIQLLEDGKVLILGSMTSYAGQSVSGRMIRVNADGTLDNTFNSELTGLTQGGPLGTWTDRMAVQEDGKIVVVGYFSEVAGTTYNSIVRLNSDGSLDTEWDPGTGCDYPATDVAQDDEGRLYVVGRFSQYNGIPRSGIVRIHSVPTSTVGIAERTESGLGLWPNPAQDQLFVEAPSGTEAVQVLDATGRIVLERTGPFARPLAIGVQQLNPGTYLLHTRRGTHSSMERFMIAR